MPNSSPAPFWRFMHLNSTPVRGLTNGHDSLEDSLAFGYRTSIGGIGGGLGLYNDISPIKYVKPVEKRETSKIEVVQDENLKEKTVKKEEKAEMKEEDEISEHNKTETKPAKTATTGRLGDLRNVDLTRGFRGFHTVDKEDHLSEKELRNKGDKEKDDKSTRKISK
ncbi:hypothetical protein NADFUDRAFT_82583 [Nadsonia fulvescens var. elongata DSM 6958]|uniref:Uncharacterized protein n=1 Tax=Nadsonia fulvescens var. elongata DSM 6958 TaxID=857566 RepID=A0A1E3PJR0_9ASCO|nr:hypothetical protein NADFUDRAFT_82583 [Nadsonia fulvescens var. elongata DSM 6958]